LTVVGSGDAFGSGGRINTCFHLAAPGTTFLVDCGASAMAGLVRLGIDTRAIDRILISHLHGDHFGGLIFFLLHSTFVTRRAAPLEIAGPPGIEARTRAMAEALFPGAMAAVRAFPLAFLEIPPGTASEIGPLRVQAFEVSHPSGAPPLALRISTGGRTFAYSGDTEWTESLIPCAAGADLFVTECYTYDRPVPYHLAWTRLAAELPRLAARRILLTHMGPEMLERRQAVADARVLLAEDGLVLDV
jgi:ribonuclease BN (tRNA processing enzyme)